MKVPNKLKLETLQQLAFHCGLAKTGTKQVLSQRLRTTAQEYEPVPHDARVLSIDLGLRNFAYSLMTPGPSQSIPMHNKSPLITLHAWQHLNLLLGSTKPGNTDGPSSPDFSPGIMAQRATELVHDRLLPLQPTHILIERQRWRTAGRASVQEWTIRVNTLEAMLYGIFAALQSRRLWDGKVILIPPARVVRFLVGEDGVGRDLFSSREKSPLLLGEGKASGRAEDEMPPAAVGTRRRGGKTSSADAKLEKIHLLEEVLGWGDAIDFATPEADIGRLQFRGETNPKPGRKKTLRKDEVGSIGDDKQEAGKVARMIKRDDLSDCLLQGLVWLAWQNNIDALRKSEPWVLEEDDE